MLDPEAKRQIIDSPADALCTLVIASSATFDGTPGTSRRTALVDFYRRANAPVIRKLTESGIEVVRELPNVGTIVAKGPAAKWREMLADLERSQDVEVRPNTIRAIV